MCGTQRAVGRPAECPGASGPLTQLRVKNSGYQVDPYNPGKRLSSLRPIPLRGSTTKCPDYPQ